MNRYEFIIGITFFINFAVFLNIPSVVTFAGVMANGYFLFKYYLEEEKDKK